MEPNTANFEKNHSPRYWEDELTMKSSSPALSGHPRPAAFTQKGILHRVFRICVCFYFCIEENERVRRDRDRDKDRQNERCRYSVYFILLWKATLESHDL